MQWLAIPSISADPDRHADVRRSAEWLAGHPKVQKIYYPGLPNHPGHAIARKQMRDFGGMLSVSVKGGKEGALRVLTRTKRFSLAESLGGVESLIGHPATMTHSSIPADIRVARGIGSGINGQIPVG